MNDILLVPKSDAIQVFSAENGLDPYLQKIRDEIDGFVPDVTTRKGREAVASIAHKVSRSKTALDNVGKELVAELKELPKKIDAERKRMRDILDTWRDEVRRPLDEWESADRQRIEGHKLAIARIVALASCAGCTSDEIRDRLRVVSDFEADESLEEFQADAAKEKASAICTLNAALEKQKRHEEEQAELARLRAEAEERAKKEREAEIARKAAEAARREAEQRAQREKELAEKRELELRLAAEKAERERVIAQQAAERAEREAQERAERAVEEERKRIEAERSQQLAEQEERERDIAHKARVNRAAVAAFVAGGLSEDCAKQAIAMIARNLVPGITINY